MKLKLLLSGLFFCSLLSVSAQTDPEPEIEMVLLNEDFENIGNWMPEQEWDSYDLDEDLIYWFHRTSSNYLSGFGFSGRVISSCSWMSGGGGVALTPDNFVITPGLRRLEGRSELTFKIGGFDVNVFADYYAVYAVITSEFNAAPNKKTFMDAQTPLFEGRVTTPVATEKTLSLDAYANEEISIVFRHFRSSNVYSINLDDVKVVTYRRAGINKVLASQFTVFPNPATDNVSFTNSGNILVSQVKLSDLKGRIVKTKEFGLVSEATIDLSQLQAGIYFLNFETNQGKFTKKIIKK